MSAGYFNFLKELYNKDKDMFNETYKQLVDEGILTVFVYNDIEIIDEINIKIKKLKTYKLNLNFIHILGIGQKNIIKMKSFEEKNSDNNDFIIKNKFEKENIYIIEILPN